MAGALGKAKPNQDYGLIAHRMFLNGDGAMVVAVCDGHGLQGELASRIAASTIVRECGASTRDHEQQLRRAIGAGEKAMKSKLSRDSFRRGGTTANVAIIDRKKQTVTVATVGDSRFIKASSRPKELGGDAYGWDMSAETQDHKPNLPAEKARIEKAGSVVTHQVTKEGDTIYRFCPKGQKGGLALSRSLGDAHFKPHGLSSEPTVQHYKYDPSTDRCIIMASDGLWEFIENEEAVQICFERRGDATAACRALVLEAADRWSRTGSYRDDITVAVLFLPFDEPPPADAPPIAPITSVSELRFRRMAINWPTEYLYVGSGSSEASDREASGGDALPAGADSSAAAANPVMATTSDETRAEGSWDSRYAWHVSKTRLTVANDDHARGSVERKSERTSQRTSKSEDYNPWRGLMSMEA